MCGIVGIISKSACESKLACAVNALHHRGPDDHGAFSYKHIMLGHTRLSILDLSMAGHQPMTSEDGRFALIFNGEIYNHLTLRSGLLGGYLFRGSSDTETLFALLVNAATNQTCMSKVLQVCNGMFAFAFLDTVEQKLWLARDRMGEKPLYVYRHNGVFAFSSEIKALRAAGLPMTKNHDGLALYFTYGHSCCPTTMYNEIVKLPPAHWLCRESNGNERLERYWSPKNAEHAFDGSTYVDAQAQLLALLEDSVRLRLISDVPFGAYLSGGLDSSTLVVLMQKLHGRPIDTFSVGFDVRSSGAGVEAGGAYSELHDAAVVSKQVGSIHHQLTPTAKDLIDHFDNMVYHYDEPYSDPAAFPTYMVSKLAREHVAVCHSGEGADELFGGYRRYSAELFRIKHPVLATIFSSSFSHLEALLPRIRRLRRIAYAFSENDGAARYSRWLDTIDPSAFMQLVGKNVSVLPLYKEIFAEKKTGALLKMLLADQQSWLVDGYLEKLDKASMAWSLEGRVPFLDHRIVEFANSLPPQWKIGKTTKRILRDTVRSMLPVQVIKKAKRGFAVPLDEWFRTDLRDFCKERLLTAGSVYNEYGLNKQVIETHLAQHQQGLRDNSLFIWQVLVFVSWAMNKTA